MVRFILRRVLWLIPSTVIVTFLVYIALRIGTNPLNSYLRTNPRASRAKIQQYIEVNGLYDGFTGYIRGYGRWLWSMVRGPDAWPRSIKGSAEVYPSLKNALMNTLRLAGVSTTLGISIGLVFGVIAALRPGKLRDTTINSGAFILGSIPPFVTAVLLQLLFAVKWNDWFGSPLLPVAGVYPPGQNGFDLALLIKHMILPVTVVAIQTIAGYSRYMRASLLEVLNSEYLRTARSKGISERRVLFRHSIRNALIPIVTIIAVDAGAILGGLIITENIFAYPGMGKYFLDSVGNGDFPRLMPWMVLIVISVLMFNLIADLSYAWLDPRIRLD